MSTQSDEVVSALIAKIRELENRIGELESQLPNPDWSELEKIIEKSRKTVPQIAPIPWFPPTAPGPWCPPVVPNPIYPPGTPIIWCCT